jgi:DNA primase
MAEPHWFARARAVRIQDEVQRRGIKLRGGVDRCGPCPVCGGNDRFSINTEKQLWNCRGCDIGGDIIGLVKHLDGLDFNAAARKLAGEPASNGNGHGHGTRQKVETFEYCNETGAVRFAVDRITFLDKVRDGKFEKKIFQKQPDPDKPGEWISKSGCMDGVERVPYRLPELIEAVAANHPILIVEGEPKVDALAAIGVAATCNAGGAGKWPPEFSALYLRGANVVLCPDNDEPGFRHINDVGASLAGIAAATRVLILPDLKHKGDVKDWLDAGGTREQLDALLENAPLWRSPSDATPDDGKQKAASGEQAIIDALARLGPLDYDRRRRDAADELGIRNETLDNAVNRRRAEREEEEGPPPLFGHWVASSRGRIQSIQRSSSSLSPIGSNSTSSWTTRPRSLLRSGSCSLGLTMPLCIHRSCW